MVCSALPPIQSDRPASCQRAVRCHGRGLPVGLQIVGPSHADARVLRAARASKRCVPGRCGRRPFHPSPDKETKHDRNGNPDVMTAFASAFRAGDAEGVVACLADDLRGACRPAPVTRKAMCCKGRRPFAAICESGSRGRREAMAQSSSRTAAWKSAATSCFCSTASRARWTMVSPLTQWGWTCFAWPTESCGSRMRTGSRWRGPHRKARCGLMARVEGRNLQRDPYHGGKTLRTSALSAAMC